MTTIFIETIVIVDVNLIAVRVDNGIRPSSSNLADPAFKVSGIKQDGLLTEVANHFPRKARSVYPVGVPDIVLKNTIRSYSSHVVSIQLWPLRCHDSTGIMLFLAIISSVSVMDPPPR